MSGRSEHLYWVEIGRWADKVVGYETPKEAGFYKRIYGDCQILFGASGAVYLQSYRTAVRGVIPTPAGRIHVDLWGCSSNTTSRHISASYAYRPLWSYDREALTGGMFFCDRTHSVRPGVDSYVGPDPFEEASWYDPEGRLYENLVQFSLTGSAIGRQAFFDREDHGKGRSFYLIEYVANALGERRFVVHNPDWDRLKRFNTLGLTREFVNKEEAVAYGEMDTKDKVSFAQTLGRLEGAA